MAKVTITNSRLVEAVATMNQIEKSPVRMRDKLLEAITKFKKANIGVIEEYNAERESIALSNALEDKITGELLLNTDGSFKYSKAGLKKRDEEFKDLLKKEVDVITYNGNCQRVASFPPFVQNSLNGILIRVSEEALGMDGEELEEIGSSVNIIQPNED